MRAKYPLIAFYLKCIVVGFTLSAVFSGALVAMDVARLGHLVLHVRGGYLAGFLLWFFNGLVFSSAQASVAVLLMAERKDRGGGKGKPHPAHQGAGVPVPVRVR